jgi:RecG-like helicase
MNNDELEKALAEAKLEVSAFGPDKELSNQQWRRKMQLVEQREVLEKIQKAHTKSDLSREARLMAYYHLLVQEKTMNPFLFYLLKLRIRSMIWI